MGNPVQVQVLLTADFNFCVKSKRGGIDIEYCPLSYFTFLAFFLTSSGAIGIKKAKNSDLHVI